eukprot:13321148-Ditylum_brightwellii.AAC.1
MAGTADSVQELESVDGDDDGVDLEMYLPDLDQEGKKSMEKWRCRCVKLMSLLKCPHLTLHKDQGCKRNLVKSRDNVEDDENDDAELEEYWKDGNLVSSLPVSDQFGNKNVEKMEV